MDLKLEQAITKSSLSAAMYSIDPETVLLVRYVKQGLVLARLCKRVDVNKLEKVQGWIDDTALKAIRNIQSSLKLSLTKYLGQAVWESVPEVIEYVMALGFVIDDPLYIDGAINATLIRQIEGEAMDYIPAKKWSWWGHWMPSDKEGLVIELVYDSNLLAWRVNLYRGEGRLAGEKNDESLLPAINLVLEEAGIQPDASS